MRLTLTVLTTLLLGGFLCVYQTLADLICSAPPPYLSEILRSRKREGFSHPSERLEQGTFFFF